MEAAAVAAIVFAGRVVGAVDAAAVVDGAAAAGD